MVELQKPKHLVAIRREIVPPMVCFVPIFNGQTNPAPPDAAMASSRPSNYAPSYASPTRASLARSNPELLESHEAIQRGTDHGSQTRSTGQASEVSFRSLGVARDAGTTAQLQDTTTESVEPQSPIRSAPRRPKESKLRDTLTAHLEQRMRGAPTAAPQAPGGSDAPPVPSRNAARQSLGGLGAAPKRSPFKPKPRPLPPPEPGSEEEELLDPFARRGLRRTPPGGGAPGVPRESLPFVVPPENEPELPPTPTQQGKDDPLVTTPPSGIHETPSRRARRRSSNGKKSSPLKHQSFPTRDPGTPTKSKGEGKGKAAMASTEDDPDVVVDEERTLGARGGGGTHPARGIPPIDEHAEKKALREELRAEVARLEADLRFAELENERIHQMQNQRQTSKWPSHQRNGEELLGLFQRYLLPSDDGTPPDPSQLLFDAAMDPTSWLSLSATTPAPLLAPPKDDSPPPVSHHPIPMTAKEELGFLQAFTPFEFSSTTEILPREDTEAPLLRQHNLSVREPDGLFAAKLEMVVNADTLRIDELRVPRLDPAAIAELGPFVETICSGKQNSAMDRNVGILGWAMAEWYRLSVERARVWCLLERETGDRDRLLETVRRTRMRKRPRRRTRRQGPDDGEGEGEEEVAAAAAVEPAGALPRAALLAHMGRTAFEVPIPEDDEEDESRWPCLRIQWRIEFDWTGEGVSRVGVLLGVPGKWREAHDGGALAGVQKVFGDLVKGDESPLNAVRTVLSLLVGDVSTRRPMADTMIANIQISLVPCRSQSVFCWRPLRFLDRIVGASAGTMDELGGNDR
ncbi:hypothetical protein SODALDRAFT_374923 [Sodiomyces alkalinus F11]|uniref:Uncharacterized protein n=1 Tax=Sodiomyces alkalinus (strain CBS 110278 / VKM F-3762 / F11) TaxID=1314773 RepID=A0A3N2Q7A3_SODAK|nr:hypothetical protein SODALDRAFT_374923 [Sodiomyces alkalinus F11]ROT42622.1 hypothetical protein SODALDRAFT_374923 [Sodiomyces alkalinus F11]